MADRTKRILVVDDDVSLCKLIARILERDQYTVLSCQRGTDALKLVRNERFDLLLLDVGLPDMNGMNLLSQWRDRGRTKVIVVTADDTAETLVTAIRNGAYFYIRKPFEPEQLRDLVAEALKPQDIHHIEVISAKRDWLELSVPCSRESAERIDQFMRQIQTDLPEEAREGVAHAFRELLMNAVEWGGGFDPQRCVRISLLRSPRMLQYRVCDPGPGFNPADLAHAAINNAPGDLLAHEVVRRQKGLRPGGLGLKMVRAIADELLYNEKHNEVVLIKYLDTQAKRPKGQSAKAST
jgi:CheY-like chemotaxis protein